MAKPVEMPYSLEAEQSILGCILIDQEMQNEILVEIEETDFYLESLEAKEPLEQLAKDLTMGALTAGLFDDDWDQRYVQGIPTM